MINFTLYKESQAQLTGPELNPIREHFSVENKAANFKKDFVLNSSEIEFMQ